MSLNRFDFFTTYFCSAVQPLSVL